MLDPIFSLFGKRIARKLAANHYRPLSFKDLSFAFTDKEGHHYYTWKDFGEMPPARVKGVEAIMLMIDTRMSDKDLALISDEMQALIQGGVISGKSPKDKAEAAAKLMILAQELKYRAKDMIPEDLYYDLAAHCVVREDENPGAMDRTIHTQKVSLFRDAGRQGATFFLTMPIFSDLLGALLTTEAGLLRLLPRWKRSRERREMISRVLSKSVSADTATASTGSPSKSQARRPKAFQRS